jgi:hypothetical protein
VKRYQATFSLGEIGEPGPTLEAAAEACVRWATSRDGAQARPLPLDRDVPATEGYFGTVRTLRDDESETARWGLESRVKDREEPEVLTWVTELILVRRGAGSIDFSCTSSLECRDVVRPAMRAMTRPRIVAELIEKFGGAKHYKLSSSALVVTSEQVGRFVEILLARDRTRPVVYVSARNRDDNPCIDADALAFQLAGTAHVFVGDSRFPSLELKRYLAQSLGCWDGAVRLYWPRMSSHDDPAEHPHWTAPDIAEFNARGDGRFAAYLLDLVSPRRRPRSTP